MSAREGIGMTSERTRMRMIEALRAGGIANERVLGAMAEVPRHLFVDEGIASRAYEDVPLPIGHGQTISSPMIVAMMTELLLEKKPMDKVLEIGTGCGYQTAVLARLVKEVYTLERIAPLMDKARRHLRDLRFYNVRSACGRPRRLPRARRTTESWLPRRPRTFRRRSRSWWAADGCRRSDNQMALRDRSRREAHRSAGGVHFSRRCPGLMMRIAAIAMAMVPPRARRAVPPCRSGCAAPGGIQRARAGPPGVPVATHTGSAARLAHCAARSRLPRLAANNIVNPTASSRRVLVLATVAVSSTPGPRRSRHRLRSADRVRHRSQHRR